MDDGTFAFSADGANPYIVFSANSGDMTQVSQFELPLLTPNTFWYQAVNVSGPSVNVRGFMLNL